jgi:hypothetical protein
LVPLVHQPRFKLKLLRGSDVLKNEEELTLPEALLPGRGCAALNFVT